MGRFSSPTITRNREYSIEIGALMAVLFAGSCFGQVRLFGTNTLIDFTGALRAGPNSAYSNYWVKGTVSERIGQSAIVERETGNVRFYYDPSSPEWSVGTSGLLKSAAAQQLDSGKGISLGQYLAMSPRMQLRYKGRRETEMVMVLRVPDGIRAGDQLQSCALSIGQLRPNGRSAMRGFDCGTGYSGSMTNLTNWFIATPSGLRPVQKK